ncbi:MAG: hypothetical protein K2Y21_06165 [Phycisphaerales bacterium]|nr:hypothetical protein [Phycisphaerales bacterium]
MVRSVIMMARWIAVACAALMCSAPANAQATGRWFDWFVGLPRLRTIDSGGVEFRGELIVYQPGYGYRAWNGSSWRILPMVSGGGPVMAVFANRLYVAGGGKVLSFDGSTWAFHGTHSGDVYAMVPFNGELILAGAFTRINNVPCNRIARFDGVRFAPIGTGFNAGFVGALTVWNGRLYAAGSFGASSIVYPPGVSDPRHVAVWNGTGWQTVGAGLNSTVKALAVHNGKLVAGGFFDISGPGSGARVAQFDGTSWSSLSPTFNKNISTIFTLTSFSGGLVAGGLFSSSEGFVGCMLFDGTNWVSMDGGAVSPLSGQSFVYRSLAFRDQVVLFGIFDFTASIPAYGMAAWGTSVGGNGLRVDINADGRRDIILRNPSTGMLRAWMLDANLDPTSRDIIVTGLDWDMVGSGDFNADGETDFLWSQSWSGRLHMSMFSRGNYLAPREMRGSPRANLVVAGVADMNNDAIPDLIWRDLSNGEQGIWLLNAAGAPTFSPLPNVPTTEELVLVSDVDSDRTIDIVYRTIATGSLYSRRVNASSLAAPVAITTPGAGWSLAAAADYNADGRTDRLWVKDATNEAIIQIMGPSGVTSTKTLPNLPSGFVVKR